ncbi:hypothetical protein BY458DRAFT_554364 [Sporodiniella umbellata]|nr:hypothetical protein BY458DRAFT_554364 [Sporodiniella umbellata]
MSRRPTVKKIDISMIGNPTDFRHTYHVGSDTTQSTLALDKTSNDESHKTSHISLNDTISNKECGLSSTWIEPAICSETFKNGKSSNEALFKDALDAKIIELIKKKPKRPPEFQ